MFKQSLCPLCGGKKKKGKTTFTVELGTGLVVVRDVPALVCVQCGQDWVDDKTAGQLEIYVANARHKHAQLEVASFK